jgi:hypothetical protein
LDKRKPEGFGLRARPPDQRPSTQNQAATQEPDQGLNGFTAPTSPNLRFCRRKRPVGASNLFTAACWGIESIHNQVTTEDPGRSDAPAHV